MLKSEKQKKLGDKLEFDVVVPTSELIEDWEISSLSIKGFSIGDDLVLSTIQDVIYRKLRFDMSMIYSMAIKLKTLRDISAIEFIFGNIPEGKGLKVKDVVYETIDNFSKEKKRFELIKKNILNRLNNYQALPSKIVKIATNHISWYDEPKRIQGGKEKIKNFTFEQAVDWVEQWLNRDRILVTLTTP